MTPRRKDLKIALTERQARFVLIVMESTWEVTWDNSVRRDTVNVMRKISAALKAEERKP